MSKSRSLERILITGASGFAGTHLTEFLLHKYQAKQIYLTSSGKKITKLQQLFPQSYSYQIDFTNYQQVEYLLKKVQPTQIYHLASIAQSQHINPSNQWLVLNINQLITFNLLQAVLQLKLNSKILNIGSGLIYQQKNNLPLKETDPINPHNVYGLSKFVQEQLAEIYYHQHQLNIIKARPFNHYGEYQESGFVVADFCKQIAQLEKGANSQPNHSIKVGDLSAIRDFLYVKDVVHAYYLIMNYGVINEVYNIASGQGQSIRLILTKLIKFAKINVLIDQDSSLLREKDISLLVGNPEKLKKLGWQPQFTLDDSLLLTLNWYRKKI